MRLTTRAGAAALAVVGLGASLYLALVHYAQGQVPLACATSGVVNCELVTSSAQSSVGPIPVAVLGVAWFVGMLALLGAERQTGSWTTLARQLELGWTAAGVVMVLYLVFAELFLIGALCLWCTLVHVLVVLLFLLAVARASSGGQQPDTTPYERAALW